jgi:protein tyrosine/serine phosphatase
MWVVSAYIDKKRELTQGSASDKNSRQNTSETLLTSHSLDTIICENTEKSTENVKKVEKSSRKSLAWNKARKKNVKAATKVKRKK